MALTYRTPMEDIVTSFEPAVQSAIAAKASLEYKKLEEDNFQIANYFLKAEAKQKLSSAGIYLSPFSAVVHSHPVCKTLENHILYRVLPNYVNNKFFFVGIKNSKINLLKSRDSSLDMIKVINRYVTSRDKSRYTNDFVVRSSNQIYGLARHKQVLADVTLKDLVPNLMQIKAKHLFLHDELHYWREKDLITFLEVIQPEVLLGTVVFPPEILIGSKASLNPWCYQFEIQDQKLLFYPDGDHSEGYEQPLKCGYLLTTNKIRLPNGDIYSVDLICSKFSHHLFAITKGESVVNEFRSFNRFEAVSFAGLLNLSVLSHPFFPISYDVVSRLYRYLRSLKKPDHQSAMAKLSQIVPDPTPEEIKFTQEFADLVISSDPVKSILSVNRIQNFLTRACMHILPQAVSDKLDSVKSLCLDDFIRNLKPLCITKKLREISESSIPDFFSWSEVSAESGFDLPESLDTAFSCPRSQSGKLFPSQSEISRPYVGLSPLSSLSERGTIIHVPSINLIKALARRVLSSCPDNVSLGLDLQGVKTILKESLISCSILLDKQTILSDEVLVSVLSRIKALLVRKKSEGWFSELSIKWFQLRKSCRKSMLYLTNYEDEPRRRVFDGLWGAVIRELPNSPLLLQIDCESCLQESSHLVSGVESGDEKMPSDQTKESHEDPQLMKLIEELGLGDIDLPTLKNYILLSNEETKNSKNKEAGSIEESMVKSTESPRDEADRAKMSRNLVKISSLDESKLQEVSSHLNLVQALSLFMGFEESEVGRLLAGKELPTKFEMTEEIELKIADFIHSVYDLFSVDLSIILSPFESTFDCFKLLHNSVKNTGVKTLFLKIDGSERVSQVLPKNTCVIQAIAEALDRDIGEIFHVLSRPDYQDILQQFLKGEGIEVHYLEQLMIIFGIHAEVTVDEKVVRLNSEGKIPGCFKLENNHLELLSKRAPTSVCNLNSGPINSTDFEEYVTLKLHSIGSLIKFRPKMSRASLLADCLHSGSTGVMSSELFNGKPHLLKDKVDPLSEGSSFEICAVLGTFGVGKSSLFKQLVSKARGRKFNFVSPRRALLNEIKEDIGFGHSSAERKRKGQQNWSFDTFEVFLTKVNSLKRGQVVFMDEIQLYPNGYLDLLLLTIKVNINLVVFGDPCQSDYDNENDRFALSNITSNVAALLKGNHYKYNILSYRFENKNFQSRLPCLMSESNFSGDAKPYLVYNDLDKLELVPQEYRKVILVSSFEEKRIVQSYCPDAESILTFGESTGLNFNFGSILITMISEKTSERRWVTALSRFKKNVALVNATGYSLESLCTLYRGRFLGKFLTGTACVEDLLPLLPGKPTFTEGFSSLVGRDEGIREEKLTGDPWLKSMIDLFQLEDFEVVDIQEIAQEVENFKIHLPREEMEGIRTRWVHKILSKEARECRLGHLVSDQFTDEHSKQMGAMILTNAAERFEAIYPRHRSTDTVTFIMAVKKRLRFSKPHKEAAKLREAMPYGKYLLGEFLQKVPLKKTRDHLMMEEARQDFFDKKVSKSAATIENHNIRSCRDWLADVVQVFSKSQICTKFDNRFRSAKAAQSIACFQHSVLCRFAPYMRYIEKKLHQALPDRFYIHSGKGLEELNDWVLKGNFDGICTESDYEAFDASQDQYIVAFEVEVMKYLGLPHDLIQDYIYIKTHLGSKLGGFAIMRFTGEASTFLFNTMANMLFTFLRYNLNGNERICFAGDDMCASSNLQLTLKNEGFLKKIKLKAKVQKVSKPTFCGWHLSSDGIYKKPQLVYERMCIAKETNNLHNCIDSYAIEISYAYKMGEKVFHLMDEEELGAYYGCVRTIIKHKHLLKSNVKALFESLD